MLKTVKTVRASPEYQKVLQIVREKGVNEESITEILRTLYGPSLRGNVFNDWKSNRISLCSVLTYIKFHNSEYRIDQIFQLTLFYPTEGNSGTFTCSTMPIKYQSTQTNPCVKSEPTIY